MKGKKGGEEYEMKGKKGYMKGEKGMGERDGEERKGRRRKLMQRRGTEERVQDMNLKLERGRSEKMKS